MNAGEHEEPRDQVIADAARAGHAITADQLARWHRAGLLPRPRQLSLGRGRGTISVYPAGTGEQVVALCQFKDEDRRLDRVACRLWWEGFPVDLALIRRQLLKTADGIAEAMEHAGEVPRGRARGFDAVMTHGLGPRRLATMVTAATRPRSDGAARLARWEAARPPSLDDLARFIGDLIADWVTGVRAAEILMSATEDDLLLARERARFLLSVMQELLGPLAWIFGKGGKGFRLLDRAQASLDPADHVAVVALMVLLAPAVPRDTMEAIDAGRVPEVARELRLVMAVRDQVPGAADVLTPMAIRALWRDNEAARHHLGDVQEFAENNRQQIDAIVASLGLEAGRAQSQPAAPRQLRAADEPA
jgi:hypothetical protein